MAILGSAPAESAAYDAGRRRRVLRGPPEVYRSGRGRFLAGLRAAPRIFLTPLFHDRLDAAARANLAGALARL